MAINSGEINELLIKLKLIELRDASNPVSINGEKLQINSVSFDDEYLQLPANIDLKKLQMALLNFYSAQLSIDDLKKIAYQVGASKSPSNCKADVFINGDGYSIKSFQCAPPAIVNHTHRAGFIRVCNSIGTDIDLLDSIIEDYWNKRLTGKIREDICNSDSLSPFNAHKDYLVPILNYFLFYGTGQRDSSRPAKYILDFVNPLDINTWRIHDSNYILSVWDKLVFSVREKGMPPSYPYCVNYKQIAPWGRQIDGLYKGSLHVRVRR